METSIGKEFLGTEPDSAGSSINPETMPARQISVRVAETEEDRRRAFRLRYEVYIAEQGKPYPNSDHEHRLLTDALDEAAEIIIVESEGEVVGTVRANWFDSEATRREYPNMFDFISSGDVPVARAAVCSRLAVRPDHRDSRTRELLFESIFATGLSKGTKLCFATCVPILARLFKRYGFRAYAPPMKDPVAGTLFQMLLTMDDLEHLLSVRSPFAAMLHPAYLSRINALHSNNYRPEFAGVGRFLTLDAPF